MGMPNRTIYISDADVQIFEKAQQLAGDNLSATIVKALRRFIDMQEQELADFSEITVKVGKQVMTKKQFIGRLLAQGRFKGSNEGRVEVFQVYQTRKGAIALYKRNVPDWGAWSHIPFDEEALPGFGKTDKRDKLREKAFETIEKSYEKMGNWDEWRGEYTFEVFEAIEKIKELVPEELYTAAAQNLFHGPVEILDI
jgi:EXLDI family protein